MLREAALSVWTHVPIFALASGNIRLPTLINFITAFANILTISKIKYKHFFDKNNQFSA